MDTRKITLIATIAAIALVAVGIGYAYTATTVTTGNTITATDIVISTYTNADGSGDADYTGTAKNVKYNTYNTGSITYNFNGAYSLTEIQTVKIVGTETVELSSLTMTTSKTTEISTYLTEHPNCINAVLKDSTGNITYTSSYSDGVWTFTANGNNKITATTSGVVYQLSFTTVDEEENLTDGHFYHSAPLSANAFTITFKGTVNEA